MAKKKKKPAADAGTTVGNGDPAVAGTSEAGAAAPAKGGKPESVAGYFRGVFKENPKLLKARSNQPLLNRWLADHPDQPDVPKAVKQNLANLKSVLRSKKRTRGAGRAADRQAPGRRTRVETLPTGGNPLEALEHQIDECLALAKAQDREGLASVISLLRRARNAVVWKLGQ